MDTSMDRFVNHLTRCLVEFHNKFESELFRNAKHGNMNDDYTVKVAVPCKDTEDYDKIKQIFSKYSRMFATFNMISKFVPCSNEKDMFDYCTMIVVANSDEDIHEILQFLKDLVYSDESYHCKSETRKVILTDLMNIYDIPKIIKLC